jgi:disulfide bond formation protein DsbB
MATLALVQIGAFLGLRIRYWIIIIAIILVVLGLVWWFGARRKT